jgi:nucleoside 2-deoxyribosyltransferase
MKKVFLSTAFSHKVDYQTGAVVPEFRAAVAQILKALREEAKVEVYCALEATGWKMAADDLPEVGVQKDLAELDAADELLALVHEQPSVGVQFEIGYAVAKGKPVILAMEAGGKLAYFNQGVVSIGLVTLVTYDDASSLIKQLAIAVHAPEEEVAT